MPKEIGIKRICVPFNKKGDYNLLEKELSEFFNGEGKDISFRDVQITHSFELKKMSKFSGEIVYDEIYTLFYLRGK